VALARGDDARLAGGAASLVAFAAEVDVVRLDRRGCAAFVRPVMA